MTTTTRFPWGDGPLPHSTVRSLAGTPKRVTFAERRFQSHSRKRVQPLYAVLAEFALSELLALGHCPGAEGVAVDLVGTLNRDVPCSFT